MSNDVRRIIYGTLIAFLLVIGLWIGFLFTVACGGTLGCPNGEPTPARTSIATLPAATLPPSKSGGVAVVEVPLATALVEPPPGGEEVARPSNPGGAGPAILLPGNPDLGAKLFTVYCVACHGEQGQQGVENPGSVDGSVPPLKPIDSTLTSRDPQVFGYNVDLFLEHGSRPEGDAPAKVMPAWGDQGVLTAQQIADIIAYVISLNP
jgi:mono/diheme cytochrome c family protein